MTTQALINLIKPEWGYLETDEYIYVPSLFKAWKKKNKIEWYDIEYVKETRPELLRLVSEYNFTLIEDRELDAPTIQDFFEDTPFETQDEWLGETYTTDEVWDMLELDDIDEGDNTRYFSSGARRDSDKGKHKFTYLPIDVLGRVADHYEEGAKKYGDHNWRKGIPSTTIMDSLLRHVAAYYQGQDDEDHLSAIVFNALCLIYNEDKMTDNEEVYDLPKWWLDRKFWTQAMYDAYYENLEKEDII